MFREILLPSLSSEDAVENLNNNIIEESKYCTDIMKKDCNRELAVTKKDNEDFQNSTKCWICDDDYGEVDVKVRDHCHFTEKCRGSAHRDRNINIKLNHQNPIIFLDSTTLKIVWKKITTIFKRHVSIIL